MEKHERENETLRQQIVMEKKKYEELLEEKQQHLEDTEQLKMNQHLERKKIHDDVKSTMQEV